MKNFNKLVLVFLAFSSLLLSCNKEDNITKSNEAGEIEFTVTSNRLNKQH